MLSTLAVRCRWLIWANWISPFAWGVHAFSVNELNTPKWNSQPFPGQPGTPLGIGALQLFGVAYGEEETALCIVHGALQCWPLCWLICALDALRVTTARSCLCVCLCCAELCMPKPRLTCSQVRTVAPWVSFMSYMLTLRAHTSARLKDTACSMHLVFFSVFCLLVCVCVLYVLHDISMRMHVCGLPAF